MTYAEIATLARFLSRTTTSGVADASLWPMITETFRDFAVNVHGLPATDYIEVAARFFPRTHFGYHLEITGSTNNNVDKDIAATDSDADDQTGDQMATELQAQIRTAIGGTPDLTVTWVDFHFVVNAIDSTAIAITSPEDTTEDVYVDYTRELFGGEISGTTSATGTFPLGCTEIQTIPSDVITVNKVMWDTYSLEQVNDQAMFGLQESSGDPRYYKVRGSNLHLYPCPNQKKRLYVSSKRLPVFPAAPDGTTTISELPIAYHRAIAYGVSALLLEGAFEAYLSRIQRVEYEKGIRNYTCAYNNATTDTKVRSSNKLWYGVEA